MRRPCLLRLSLAALASILCGAPVHAQQVGIPGTTVTIAPPPGFTLSRTFRGLQNADTGSSIAVVEYPPEAYAELAQVFESPKTASSRYAAEGTRITRIEQVEIDGRQVPLAIGGRRENGKEVGRYIALLGGAEAGANTVLVTFNVAAAGSLGRGAIEAALQSVTVGRPATLEEKLARLPFSFEAAAPFHTADVLPDGTAVLTTFEGVDRSGLKPLTMINLAATSATPAETAQAAERVLRATAGFANGEIVEQAPAPFAGGEGHFISAKVGPRSVLQFFRVLPGGRFVRLLAFGEPTALADAEPAVKEIAASVRLGR